ncbi:CU044_2847 family protein [Shewanella sp. TC10]|uniref:CU044_2847 family protein n=1 Tax=Shewanella sp. TC10 TaxID=1419739 RepID=UPI00129E7806|nr:CU044_2847 family protein [Shewanella sp. TC10]
MNKIIKLKDGIEVEVEIDEHQAREISFENKVNTSISDMKDFLTQVVKPISTTYKELNQTVGIAETKVTLGLKVGLEGSFILAKSTTEAHIQVEMVLRKIHE